MASVQYLANPAGAQAAWTKALGRENQHAPFDRLAWWSALNDLCLPDEKPLLALASDGEARCALALMHRPGSGHLRSLGNWYSFWARPVFAAGGEALLPALTRDLARKARRITLQPLAQADAEPTAAAFAAAGWNVRAEQADVNHRVELAGRSFAEYWAARPGRLRETVRRKGAKGLAELHIVDRFDQAEWADYEAVYAQSWKPEEGSPAFLRRFAEEEGAAGTLRLGVARIDGRPVAAQLWTVDNGTAYIHKLAHVEDAKAHSPGTLLSHALFAHVIDRDGVRTIDFGSGDDGYKRDWMERARAMLRLDMHRPLDPRSWPYLLRDRLRGPGFPLAALRHGV
ncbi:GNAT family N-acetyltransferase [Novosphingobium sp. Gsoil 351]|uniref:GNAT family N-acetyltransferase n=1 Tax=Novosphingobium sp. Gsoil 351 TaxID=2675225 RepID=UPI0012B4DA99|nr:GNAT family N-acetyltransferase [Novosphingobium sp. Gsoil 351]QGN53203.1 GNAT family N-acetyltransferase [Novosphingobium sp. Gsoil 351]